MEKSGKHQENQVGTPKRYRVEDEISPGSVQETKQRRMAAKESQLGEILAKLQKLDAIDAIQADIASIKSEQRKFFDSIDAVETKIGKLEKDVEELKGNHVSVDIVEKVRELNKRDAVREQSLANDTITIKSLPLEIHENKQKLQEVICNIFDELGMEINESQYTAYTVKAKKSVIIVIKFSTGLLKAKVVKKYREVKKHSPIEAPFIVEKMIHLPDDHHLNGTLLSIVNKLTPHNAQLIKNARQYVNSHFDFVFDTPECAIMVKAGGKFHRIDDEEDLKQLIDKLESQKGTARKGKQTQQNPSSVKTRSAAKKVNDTDVGV